MKCYVVIYIALCIPTYVTMGMFSVTYVIYSLSVHIIDILYFHTYSYIVSMICVFALEFVCVYVCVRRCVCA